MYLTRGYPWRLGLSERELSLIEKALEIVIAEKDLKDDEHQLAEKLLFNMTNVHERVNLQRQNREGPQAEEDLHENLERA